MLTDSDTDVRADDDPWFDPVALWIVAKEKTGVTHFSVSSVLDALGVERSRWGAIEERRVRAIMTELGFERARHGRMCVYERRAAASTTI